jgi:hypothetical protein
MLSVNRELFAVLECLYDCLMYGDQSKEQQSIEKYLCVEKL